MDMLANLILAISFITPLEWGMILGVVAAVLLDAAFSKHLQTGVVPLLAQVFKLAALLGAIILLILLVRG